MVTHDARYAIIKVKIEISVALMKLLYGSVYKLHPWSHETHFITRWSQNLEIFKLRKAIFLAFHFPGPRKTCFFRFLGVPLFFAKFRPASLAVKFFLCKNINYPMAARNPFYYPLVATKSQNK